MDKRKLLTTFYFTITIFTSSNVDYKGNSHKLILNFRIFHFQRPNQSINFLVITTFKNSFNNYTIINKKASVMCGNMKLNSIELYIKQRLNYGGFAIHASSSQQTAFTRQSASSAFIGRQYSISAIGSIRYLFTRFLASNLRNQFFYQ